MQRIAKFEKVSFEQFKEAWLKNFPETQDVKAIYDNIKLPKRATVGSAGYDFYAPADITIMDLNKEWTVDCWKFYTRGKFTPYNGKQCKGKAVATMMGGRFVMKDGIVG